MPYRVASETQEGYTPPCQHYQCVGQRYDPGEVQQHSCMDARKPFN